MIRDRARENRFRVEYQRHFLCILNPKQNVENIFSTTRCVCLVWHLAPTHLLASPRHPPQTSLRPASSRARRYSASVCASVSRCSRACSRWWSPMRGCPRHGDVRGSCGDGAEGWVGGGVSNDGRAPSSAHSHQKKNHDEVSYSHKSWRQMFRHHTQNVFCRYIRNFFFASKTK
jgi:hypothetical protein